MNWCSMIYVQNSNEDAPCMNRAELRCQFCASHLCTDCMTLCDVCQGMFCPHCVPEHVAQDQCPSIFAERIVAMVELEAETQRRGPQRVLEPESEMEQERRLR